VPVSSRRAGELAAADPVIRLASECGDFAHRSGVSTDSSAEAAAEERGWAGVSAGRAMRG
jgi:D-serine deaminase-like pyridoxal phosphate-dependent protein